MLSSMIFAENRKRWGYDGVMKETTALEVRIRRLAHSEGLPLPCYATAGSAGADVRSARDITIAPGEREAIDTGLVFEIPDGYELQVRPRSGLARREGLTLINAPGTIDSDYRGEVKILVVNLGRETVEISRGERIAQLVLAPVIKASFVETEQLSGSERGAGGFGSTGKL